MVCTSRLSFISRNFILNTKKMTLKYLLFIDSKHAFSAYFHNLFHTKITNCLNNTCKDHWDIFRTYPDLIGFSVDPGSTVCLFFNQMVYVTWKVWPLHSWRRNAHSSWCVVRIRLQTCLNFRHRYPHGMVLIPKVFSFNPEINIAWIFFFFFSL